MANILVCDDDREIVDAIEIYLSQDGYKIFKAYDGAQAIELLKKEDIQLLIMDITEYGQQRRSGRTEVSPSLICQRSRRIQTRFWDSTSGRTIISPSLSTPWSLQPE